MFIRYNEALDFWEYDTSAGQTGAGPWVILPVNAAYLIGGGLPANLAYTDITNIFKAVQVIESGFPILELHNINDADPAARVRFEKSGNFYISFTNHADNAYNHRWVFDTAGGLTVPGGLAAGSDITSTGGKVQSNIGQIWSRGPNGQLISFDTTGPVNARVWRFVQYSNGNLILELCNDGMSTLTQIMHFGANNIITFQGNYTVFNSGIHFPQLSSNPNVIDHYEEGTWTPAMHSDAGGQGTSYSIQSGVYTKVGRVVTAGFDVQIQAANWSSGNILIGGLPFMSAPGGAFHAGPVGYFSGMGTSVYSLYYYLSPNTDYMYVAGLNGLANGININIGATQVVPGTRFLGSVTYNANQ